MKKREPAIRPADSRALSKLKRKFQQFRAEITAETATPEAYVLAGEIAIDIKRLEKELIERRGLITTPQRQALAAATAEFAASLEPLGHAEQWLKEFLINYRLAATPKLAALRAANEEEARKILEETRQLDAKRAKAAGAGALVPTGPVAAVGPLVSAEILIPKIAGVAFVGSYRWELTDTAKVPREYWSPDPAKIGALVNALGLGAVEKIPGLKITEVETETLTPSRADAAKPSKVKRMVGRKRA